MLLVLFICWIIFNGNLTWEIAILGAAVSALIYLFMCKFLQWSIKKDLVILKLLWFLASYIVILIVEIIKATIATIAITFDERVEVDPVIVEFDVDISNYVLRVLLANSITMTPGTITVSLSDSHYKVHALDESFAIDIDKSIFVDRLLKADKCLAAFKEEK